VKISWIYKIANGTFGRGHGRGAMIVAMVLISAVHCSPLPYW